MKYAPILFATVLTSITLYSSEKPLSPRMVLILHEALASFDAPVKDISLVASAIPGKVKTHVNAKTIEFYEEKNAELNIFAAYREASYFNSHTLEKMPVENIPLIRNCLIGFCLSAASMAAASAGYINLIDITQNPVSYSCAALAVIGISHCAGTKLVQRHIQKRSECAVHYANTAACKKLIQKEKFDPKRKI